MNVATSPAGPELPRGILDSVALFLRERVGFEVASIGHEALAGAVNHRLAALGGVPAERYIDRLRGNPRELDLLVEETSISETWILRDPAAFSWLRQWLAREWIPAHPRRDLRVLSAPCSSGEEVWTIAMALRETGFLPGRFTIDGVDLRPGAIEAARRGVYGARTFRSSDAERLREAYFERRAEGWRVIDSLRASVRFWPGNLLEGLPGTGPDPWDVVFCRNLLIYLDEAARERLLASIDRLLGPDGILFVGSAEALWMARTGKFELIPEPGAFVLRRSPRAPRRRRTTRVAVTRASRTLRAQRPISKPAPAPTPPPVDEPSDSSPRLARARELADRGEIGSAVVILRSLVAGGDRSAEAFFLLALCESGRGSAGQSEVWLDKALYLEPTRVEALELAIALREARGDRNGASILRQRLARAEQDAR